MNSLIAWAFSDCSRRRLHLTLLIQEIIVMPTDDVTGVRPSIFTRIFFPQAYLDVLAEEGPRFNVEYRAEQEGFYIKTETRFQGPLPYRVVDLKKRIADMDAQGTAVQAMSLTGPMAYWGDEEVSHKLTRAWNDAASAAHVQYPTRLVGLLTLPMLFPDRAIDELNRASKLPECGASTWAQTSTIAISTIRCLSRFLPASRRWTFPFSCIRCKWLADSARAILSLEHAELPFRHRHRRLPPYFRRRAGPAPEASLQPAARRRRVADADGTH